MSDNLEQKQGMCTQEILSEYKEHGKLFNQLSPEESLGAINSFSFKSSFFTLK
jgi:hypothetical protein